LSTLWCEENRLPELDLSRSPALSTLRCYSNQLETLDLSQNYELSSLSCYSNQLRELNLSQNSKLETIDCHDNQLEELDLSQNTALGWLYCQKNRLTELDMSQNTIIIVLNCGYNYLLSENALIGLRNCNLTFWPQYPVIYIASQPSAEIFQTENNIGGDLGIAVIATQSTILKYQWYSNTVPKNSGGTVVSGATSPNFPIPADLTLGTYYYYCVASAKSFLGTANISSDVAAVTVNSLANAQNPYILAHPKDKSVYVGDTATLSVTASAREGSISYQWYESRDKGKGTKIIGATGESYGPPTDAVGTTYYYCLITNTDFTATGNQTASLASAAAAVLVKKKVLYTNAPIEITTQPVAETFLTQGNISGSFRIEAKSSQVGALQYQWWRNIVDSSDGAITISGAVSPEYSIPTGLTEGIYYYYCVVSMRNMIGSISVISDMAKVVVSDPSGGVWVSGKIKSYNPLNQATVRLFEEGNPIAVYTTTIDGENGSGQKEQEFTLTGVAPGKYDLVITKAAHTKFTVHDLVVKEGEDLYLTKDSRPQVRLMTLRCGDINGDGNINNSDLTILWRQANYNRSASAADEPLCDLNGDGLINNIDLTVLWLAYNYNRGAVEVN
jgi:hypothetical protein